MRYLASRVADEAKPPLAKDTTKVKRRRWPRRLAIGLAVTTVGIGGVWYGIHHIPGFGPALTDGVRAVVGPGVIAWIEDTVYGIEDDINVWRHKNDAPETFWDVPASAQAVGSAGVPVIAPAPASSANPNTPTNPHTGAFPPPRFEPPFPTVATPADGVWLELEEGRRGDDRPMLAKSIVHPDKRRPFAAVAVVAMDLTRINLQLVAGTTEPLSEKVSLAERPGVIPAADHADLIAVFNGGFKALHGQYSMMLGGKIFLPPRDIACTVSLYRDGSIRIRTWPVVSSTQSDMVAYRQTPPCLVEQDVLNTKLTESTKNWGATVSGETVIRRSSIGIDASGKILFYALGEAVTAQSLAAAMKAVGAQDAAQLDVNYAYPRFLFFDHPPAAERRAVMSLVPHVDYRSLDYVKEPSPRDFFYITRRSL
jgi:hypothetical protein